MSALATFYVIVHLRETGSGRFCAAKINLGGFLFTQIQLARTRVKTGSENQWVSFRDADVRDSCFNILRISRHVCMRP